MGTQDQVGLYCRPGHSRVNWVVEIVRVEFFDPCRDAEPEGWEKFRRSEGLTAIWAYDVLGAASEGSWSPAALGMVWDRDRVLGVMGGVYIGARWPGSSRAPRRRREPVLFDVRLPGHFYGPTWHFAKDVGQEERGELLREFERGAARWLGWGLGGSVYRMVTGDDVERRGAIVRDSPGGTLLTLRWSDADGWLGTLSKSRRSELRRQTRMIEADPETVIEEGTGRTDLDPVEMAELNRRHTARLAARLDPRAPLTAGYFDRMCRRADVSVISYRDPGGRLLAFSMLFDHPTSPQHGPWAALRPEEGGRKHLYFHQYLLTVRQVIAGEKKELLGGRGMVDIKQSLGFDYVPMKLVAVPRWAMG